MRYKSLLVIAVGAACRPSAPAPGQERQPASAQDAKPTPRAPTAATPGTQPERQDPSCARENGLLPLGCPPQFGEDAWGYVSGSARNILAQASIEAKDCFRSISPAGSSSFIPPLSAVCRDGPDRKCVLVPTQEDIHEPWEFALPTPEEDPAWHVVHVDDQYSWDLTASTHIRFSWSNKDGGCEVWAEGVADLDGDNFYSTYITGVEVQDGGEFAPGLTRRELVPEEPAKRNRSTE